MHHVAHSCLPHLQSTQRGMYTSGVGVDVCAAGPTYLQGGRGVLQLLLELAHAPVVPPRRLGAKVAGVAARDEARLPAPQRKHASAQAPTHARASETPGTGRGQCTWGAEPAELDDGRRTRLNCVPSLDTTLCRSAPPKAMPRASSTVSHTSVFLRVRTRTRQQA